MLKLCGCIVIVASTSLLGWQVSRSIRKRMNILIAFAELIVDIKNEIAYKSSTTYTVLRTLLKNNKYTELYFLKDALYTRKDFVSSICNVLYNEQIPITGADKRILCDFFGGLGMSDRNSQIEHCNYYYGKIEYLIKQEEPESKNKSKLFACLGVLTGAFIIIILL